jgi:hypothetical protein
LYYLLVLVLNITVSKSLENDAYVSPYRKRPSGALERSLAHLGGLQASTSIPKGDVIVIGVGDFRNFIYDISHLGDIFELVEEYRGFIPLANEVESVSILQV